MARAEQPGDMTHYIDQGLKALEDMVNGDVGTTLHRNRRLSGHLLNFMPEIAQGLPRFGNGSLGRYMGYTAIWRPEPPQEA